jgi:hypothetical protein
MRWSFHGETRLFEDLIRTEWILTVFFHRSVLLFFVLGPEHLRSDLIEPLRPPARISLHTHAQRIVAHHHVRQPEVIEPPIWPYDQAIEQVVHGLAVWSPSSRTFGDVPFA